MLRVQDLLLTLAAIFLLIAALSLNPKTAIVASAGELNSTHQQTLNETKNVQNLMRKIRKNLEILRENNQQVDEKNYKVEDREWRLINENSEPNASNKNQNSYNYFANETNSLNARNDHSNPPSQNVQEVRVDFLRSAPLVWGQEPHGTLSKKAQNSTFLYMLNTNYLSPSDDINVAEQQQQPPFAMVPPFNQQLQQQHQPAQPNVNPNLRQILEGVQRMNPQLAQQIQSNPQYARIAQQILAGNGPAPNAQTEQLIKNLMQQQAPTQPRQPQQPFSPIQLITAPFHAFQQALAGNSPQPGAGSRTQANANQQASSDEKSSSGGRVEPERHLNSNSAAQPAAPPGLLNPFAQLPGQLAQQQPGGVPNLQALYQQLPLYQALLAARQRQEALQAAEKLRQQQQSALFGQQQPQQLFAGLLGGYPNQAPVNGAYPAANQPPQPQPPYLQPNQPPYLPPTQSPAVQPNQAVNEQPIGGTPQQVHFDDEANGPHNSAAINGQPAQPVAQNNGLAGQQDQDEQSKDQPEQTENDGNEQQDERSQQNSQPNERQPQSQEQEQEQPNQGQSGNEPKAAEEEDPDLKQFQNLANGGDSFTDLFPPGILSNNDINEIKKQQDEQARKQEEEERQRQLHQQQQQQQPAEQANGREADGNNQLDNSSPSDGDDQGGSADNEQGEGESEPEEDGSSQESPQAAALTNSTGPLPPGGRPTRFTESPGVEYN